MTEYKSPLDKSESGSSILIIDDSVETIRLLSSMLRDLGQISFATSGEAGLQLAMQRPPDLILLDVQMATMDGYEVCRKLKANPATQHCAVIFVTAHTTPEGEVAALEAGAVDFIAKPLNPPVVRARVQTHLRLQLNSTALAKLASKDALTGLYNRRYFDSVAEKELMRHRRQKLPLGIVFIDIDCFKAYNDGYGHQQGDICLRQVANAIDFATRRPDEIVARFGGEEFIVILPYSSPDDVIAYGEWICKRVQDLEIEHAFSDISHYVTISVGATSKIPQEGESMEKFIRAADEALYLAKSSGRNCSKIVIPE
ncbi:MAG TPA: diguanylate cyclase [Burkholderiaceae bacterium]|jgi:diguanylate cyclase (GGDEF)-like protein